MSKCERRPVTGDHPCIAAAVAVLKKYGGPMAVSEIFEHAEEDGLLPASAHNTIRGRFSAHARTARPLLVPWLGGGWGLAVPGALIDARAAQAPAGTGLARRVDADTLGRKGAPRPLVALVRVLGPLSLRALLLRPLTHPALTWLLGAFRFKATTRERLLRARGVQGRCAVLNHEERVMRKERAA